MGFIIDCQSTAHPALQCIFQQT
jgi:hypothetical protein